MHESSGLRPTSDRVRETLFNWLQRELSDSVCLDLYAGSGALGFEAASRGARSVLMVERDRQLAASLADTGVRIGADAVHVCCDAAEQVVSSAGDASFDILFLDPPFADGVPDSLWAAVTRIAKPEAWMYVECAAERLSTPPDCWRLHREIRTREVVARLFHRSAEIGHREL